jgi:hypothetical protein
VGFELTIPAFEQEKAVDALDRPATLSVNGIKNKSLKKNADAK